MAEDYYQTLGVGRNASQAEIQKAYRTLAQTSSRPEPQRQNRQGKIPEAAIRLRRAERHKQARIVRSLRQCVRIDGRRAHAGAAPHGGQAWYGQAAPGFEEIDLNQFFGERFGDQGGGGGGFADLFSGIRRAAQTQAGTRARRGRAAELPGNDLHSDVEIPFRTAIEGGKVEVGVPRGGGKIDRIEVKIPAGINDGGKIRLRGQGAPGAGKAPAGDLLMTVHVAPHPFFQRRGNDLIVRVPITLAEAVTGAKVDIPSPSGTIALRIPPRTNSGAKLRVRGHGVKPKNGAAGDLYAEVQIVLPPVIDDAAIEAIRKLDAQQPSNPRSELRW